MHVGERGLILFKITVDNRTDVRHHLNRKALCAQVLDAKQMATELCEHNEWHGTDVAWCV